MADRWSVCSVYGTCCPDHHDHPFLPSALLHRFWFIFACTCCFGDGLVRAGDVFCVCGAAGTGHRLFLDPAQLAVLPPCAADTPCHRISVLLSCAGDNFVASSSVRRFGHPFFWLSDLVWIDRTLILDPDLPRFSSPAC